MQEDTTNLVEITKTYTKAWEFFNSLWNQLLSVGMIVISLRIIRENGETTVSFADFFVAKNRFLTYIWANILLTLLVLLGLVLIIPGIIWVIKYSYAPILVVDKKLSAKEAFAVSAEMTEGVKWQLVGFGLFGALIMLGGLLALGIGVFLAMPVVMLASYMLYNKLLVRTKLGMMGE